MKKPIMKCEVSIVFVVSGLINLYATPDAIEDFKVFGKVYGRGSDDGRYDLFVDARYDIDEVIKYIKAYDTSEGENDQAEEC